MHTIQQKLLRLAETYNLGNMSLRDIAEIINEKHAQVIKHHLEQLEKKQLITWNRDEKVISKMDLGISSSSHLITVPVLGSANCGAANLYADNNIEGHLKISPKLLKKDKHIFAIKAVGHSMNNANLDGKNIEEGDYVIVDSQDKHIVSNDYIVSVIDDMANIKKVLIDSEHAQIILLSESTFSYPPIYIELTEASRYFVSGKIIQVIKQPRFE